MLNELYELSQALDHYGLLQPATHPDLSKVGKSNALLIELDREGKPRQTRLLDKEETSGYWKHSKGNHNSFPAIRVQKPLLQRTESQKVQAVWKSAKLEEKVALLGSLDFDAVNEACVDIKISDWSLEALRGLAMDDAPELDALRQLISVFPRKENCAGFVVQLAQYLKQRIKFCTDPGELNFIKELLVGSVKAGGAVYSAECMTYYDVYETDDFPCKVSSYETRQALTKWLNKAAAADTEEAERIISPLSGKDVPGIGEKYPNPTLPALGQTYLYSKKADTPCLARYTLSGAQAFQAGKRELDAANDALAFLTDPRREHKSWTTVCDSYHKERNLLLAYLQEDPGNDALLAEILGKFVQDLAEEDLQEVQDLFERLCKQVLGKIEFVRQKKPDSKIQMILLEKIDTGRRQVIYETALTVERFCENLLLWEEAAKNHPDIVIKASNHVTYRPFCPSPDDICRELKLHYTRSGSSKPMKYSPVAIYEIYQLYMPHSDAVAEDRDKLNAFLSIVVERSALLLGDVQHQMIRNNGWLSKKDEKNLARRAALFSALLSILLWRLGVRKENYMLDAPFNIGQFLQLADLLHREYCVQVRNKGKKNEPLPTQLMGNEMLSIASQNPNEGINRLRERMKIYLAWANTATGEAMGLAKWTLKQLGEVSAKIAQNTLPDEFTPAQQAQVLLGYLASLPKKEEKKQQGGDKQ